MNQMNWNLIWVGKRVIPDSAQGYIDIDLVWFDLDSDIYGLADGSLGYLVVKDQEKFPIKINENFKMFIDMGNKIVNRKNKYILWEGKRIQPEYEHLDILSFDLVYDLLGDENHGALICKGAKDFPIKVGEKFRLIVERVQG